MIFGYTRHEDFPYLHNTSRIATSIDQHDRTKAALGSYAENPGLLDEIPLGQRPTVMTFAGIHYPAMPAIYFRNSAGLVDESHRASSTKRATFAGDALASTLDHHRAGGCGDVRLGWSSYRRCTYNVEAQQFPTR